MILDYCYNKYTKNLEISYTDQCGNKKIYKKNILYFISYKEDPDGKFINWDGRKCSEILTNNPTKFILKQTIANLSDNYLFFEKTNPRLYTFDIETGSAFDEFPNPETAKFPIYTISIVSPEYNAIILGTKELKITEEQKQKLQNDYNEYIERSEYYKNIIKPTLKVRPYIKYIYFETEKLMLQWFLSKIIAKVSILSGWNSYGFDWPYIINRIKNNYSDIVLNSMSCTGQLIQKNISARFEEKKKYIMPIHTLILDHMELVKTYDMSGLIEKESLALDYIAHEVIGLNKIKYKGDLEALYKNDYLTYIFYNSIDSVLIQLIEHRLRILPIMYMQAIYCKEQLSKAFSKIAYCEALVFNWFIAHGYKIIDDFTIGERTEFQGAYVKEPIPGLHKWLCCNDFSSLYPSAIMSAGKGNYGGISYENYIGSDHNPKKFISAEKINEYKKNPNYFVTVDNCVFKNDKDYCLKSLQKQLKDERAYNKYLSKELDAIVMADLELLIKGNKVKNQKYHDDIQEALYKLFSYKICCTKDLILYIRNTHNNESIIDYTNKIIKILKDDISYRDSIQLAIKLLMNSIYGGSSHEAFAWYNIDVAAAITAEGRAVIHKMERHLPKFFNNEWGNLVKLHNILGININKERILKLKNTGKNIIDIIYGDTDSLYISYENLISTIDGYEKLQDSEILNILIQLNIQFLNKHNKEFLQDWYTQRNGTSIHDFELETIAKAGIWTDGKKKYVQELLWKDGKIYDIPKWKSKGFETGKPTHPRAARKALKVLIEYILLELDMNSYSLQRLNIKVQEIKNKYLQAPIEDLCENINVNNYSKYILNDLGNTPSLVVKSGCPYNVRAAGNYNFYRNKYKLDGAPIRTGKLRLYNFTNKIDGTAVRESFIAFEAGNMPDWLQKICPINKDYMFEKYVINPLNRLTEACNIGKLNGDGSIQLQLFE